MKRTLVTFAALAMVLPAIAHSAEVVKPAAERFSQPTDEVPNFRRHVIPMAGRMGCNSRACHGSFQGRGGFRLSLFGYDFDADIKAITQGEHPRVDLDKPVESLILQKPTMQVDHEGGDVIEKGTWQYQILLKWIEAGAKGITPEEPDFKSLEVQPEEIVFSKAGQKTQLRVIVTWGDGSREDVTCLCRFQTNNEQIAQVDEDGLVTSGTPGDTHVVAFYDNGVIPIPVMQPVTDKVGPKYPKVPTPTKVDQLVVQKLRKLGIVPSDVCGDAEFLRRVSLDLTGTLPTPDEVKEFLADSSPDKRVRKVDELLDRPGYAAWWTTKLCDITGNNDDALNNITPIRTRASQDWYDWIHQRVAKNVPYDKLAEGIIMATSRQEDESFKDYSAAMSDMYRPKDEKSFAERESLPHFWARRTFRRAEERAIGFAYSFMGIRIQCAQCHKHPFDQWTKQDFEDFQGFFTRVNFGSNPESQDEYQSMLEDLGLKKLRGGELRRKLPDLLKDGKDIPFQEVYAVAPRKGGNDKGRKNRNRNRNRNRGATEAKVLGGEMVNLNEFDDARTPLMEWLKQKDNRYFARSFVNRVWANYFNRGIVEPPDDLSLANPPCNKPLLDYLTQGFVENGYDMKWLHREIATSRTYQLSWKPNDTNLQDEVNFSRAVPRRLPAEVAYDAIQFATASDTGINKMVGDMDGRAIAIPGAGRRSRGGSGYALTIFGRSVRESNCDCDRSMEPSLLQTVYLQNDREIISAIGRRRGWIDDMAREMKKEPMQHAELVEQAYLRTLSRLPTEKELAASQQFLDEAKDTADGLSGLLWALLNTKEFIVNH